MSQLGGGIGTRGPGETKLETDRRRIQRRIDQFEARPRSGAARPPTAAPAARGGAGAHRCAGGLHQRRQEHALQPLTRGAGARVGADVRHPRSQAEALIELPSRRKVLLSDTVGFIRNLPHTLVTSFRATLEEVEQAEVLLHVRDAASTYGEEQKAQVEKVLGELNALSKPRIEVMNKIDLLDTHQREGIASRPREPIRPRGAGSARTGEGIDQLLTAIDEALFSDPVMEAELDVPQKEGAALAAIEAGMVIRHRSYEGNLVHLSVTGPASLLGRYRAFRSRE